MAGEWQTVEFGQVNDIFDGPHATPQFSDEGPIFLGIDALDDGRLDLSQTRHVTDEVFLDWTRRVVPQGGDLVFSYETRIGQAALIPQGLKCCLGRRLALVRPKTNAVNSQYLLYYFLAPGFQEHLRAHTKPGSTVDRIHLKDFPKFPLVLPPRRYQDAIANLLGSLDDKIELNRRMAATLEEMARALFKSWFVDFDPVRAKADGRDPGLPAATAALFPDAVGEDGLPVGWTSVAFSDLATLDRTSIDPASLRDAIVDHYSLPAFDGNRAPIREPASSIKSLKLSLSAPIVLFSKLNPDTPRVWTLRCTAKIAVASTEFLALRPSRLSSLTWLTCLLSSDAFVTKAAGMVTGTSKSHQRVQPDSLLRTTWPAPADGVMAAFEQVIAPLHERVDVLLEGARQLAALRDTLLPKLISGELRIKDANGAVEAA